MHDDQRRNQDERDAGFEDALNDLFGDTPDAAEPAAEPAAPTPRTTLEPAQSHPVPTVANVPAGDPASLPSPAASPTSRRARRNLRRIGCIALSAVFGLALLCVLTLMVIGFIVGDQATPTPTF